MQSFDRVHRCLSFFFSQTNLRAALRFADDGSSYKQFAWSAVLHIVCLQLTV